MENPMQYAIEFNPNHLDWEFQELMTIWKRINQIWSSTLWQYRHTESFGKIADELKVLTDLIVNQMRVAPERETFPPCWETVDGTNPNKQHPELVKRFRVGNNS